MADAPKISRNEARWREQLVRVQRVIACGDAPGVLVVSPRDGSAPRTLVVGPDQWIGMLGQLAEDLESMIEAGVGDGS